MWKKAFAVTVLLGVSFSTLADQLVSVDRVVVGSGPIPCTLLVVTTYTYRADDGSTYTQVTRGYVQDYLSPECGPDMEI